MRWEPGTVEGAKGIDSVVPQGATGEQIIPFVTPLPVSLSPSNASSSGYTSCICSVDAIVCPWRFLLEVVASRKTIIWSGAIDYS